MLNMLEKGAESKTASPITPRKISVERERMDMWLTERIAASRKKPSAEIITLTPVLAELLLERNQDNRQIIKNSASAITSDVANGRFEFNGESIVVSRDGVLLDGQHRCQVVVETRTPIETVMVFGPKNEARYTIDIGRPKTASNFLHMQGHKNTNVMAAAARLILIYRRVGRIISTGAERTYTPTKTEIVEAVEQLSGLANSVDLAVTSPTRFTSRSTLAACHYLIAKKSSREAADMFFRKLIDGDGLRRGDPILYLRNRLPAFRVGGGAGANALFELIFKCWNAHRRGEEVNRMPMNGRLPPLER